MNSELKSCALAVVIIIFLMKYSSADHACKRGWVKFEQSCYVYIKQKVSSMDGKIFCNLQWADLVEISSEAENAFVASLVKTNQGANAWMGINDLIEEGRWVSHTSGEPVTYTKWQPGEPNDKMHSGTESCGEVWSEGTWNDAPCSFQYDFICEMNVDAK